MPRSSRHKSSKHSTRDAREYSDSEKDAILKDRKGKEESGVRVSKESASGEKRKIDSKDSKDLFVSGNGEYLEEYDTSKRRKGRADDGVSDRWNGGEDDRGEGSKKSKSSSDSKSKKRDDSEVEEVKRSSGKSEGKHRESSRKEGREAGSEKEKEKKSKEGKSEKLVDNQEHRLAKQVAEKTESNARDQLQSVESENQLERRVRRKRDGSGDGDKHQDDVMGGNDRRMVAKDDTPKDGKPKEEKHKDERYRDKYKEDVDRDKRYRDDKQRDDYVAKDYTSRSEDKQLGDEKDTAEIRQKKSKSRDSYRDYDRERDHDRGSDFDVGRDRDRDHYRDHDWDLDRDHDHDRDRDRDRDHDRSRERDQDRYRDHDRVRRNHEREREREREYDRDRDRDLDRTLDRDGSHIDDRNARYRESRGKKRSPDDRDDGNDTKSRSTKVYIPDMEKKSLSSSRAESDADRGRSHSHQVNADATVSSNRRKTSPSPSSHGGTDEPRHSKHEDFKYRDSATEQRPKSISSREVSSFSGASERVPKHRSSEKMIKMDDGHLRELSVERSSSRASPLRLVERSPSSTSLERRYASRSGIRWSLDVEEAGRRSTVSIGSRELSANEDKLNRDVPLDKSLQDDPSQADSSFYNRNSQSNLSLIPPPPAFRAGLGSPSFMGSLEEDGRINISRYRRNGEPNMGRGQGNAWRGAPNWSSPVTNGFIPFQHGPPHGGFQAIMPQFPSPSMFGVRPSMDHSGIPYHMPDADRFPNHLRPLGWQNMLDSSGPSHLHGWDTNNGVFRDEPHIYGGPDWDQNRHSMNGRGWDASADMWKGQNGDVTAELPATSQKEDYPVQGSVDSVLAGQGPKRSQQDNNHKGNQEKALEVKSSVPSPVKDIPKCSPETMHYNTPDPSKLSTAAADDAHFCCPYLSKLDISSELAGLELYDQCMGLLDRQRSATIDEDTIMLVNLRDGARAFPKFSNTFLSSSLFPASNDSVFKRAMEHYKKQRAEMVGLPIIKRGKVHVISASSQEELGELALTGDVKKSEGPVPMSVVELLNVPLPPLAEEKLDPVTMSTTGENLEEQVSTPSPEVEDQGVTASTKLEVMEQVSSHDSPEKESTIFNGDKMDMMTSEQEISKDGNADCLPSSENASHHVAIDDGDDTLAISENKVHSAEDEQVLGDATSGPLVFSDGSPKVSGALMSNESESVILSRIHRSPESTH